MNQSFTKQQLLRYCKQLEYVDYKLTSKDLSDSLDVMYNEIIADSFEFKINQIDEYFLTHDLPNKLVLRKLNDNIKRIYKDEQANRRIIIAQVKTLLSETCPFWVIKTDIKSFYESIDRNRVISKFHDDSMLSYQSMYLLRKVFNNPTLIDKTGVPRGMNISATLSEIYMRKFDKWIRRLDGVYYYARFVDDIIIFSNSLSSSRDLINNLDDKLGQLAEGLKINPLKTELYEGKTLKSIDLTTGKLKKVSTLDYLGYSFQKEEVNDKVLSQKKFPQAESLKYTIENNFSTFHPNVVSLEFNSVQKPKIGKLKVTIADKKVKKIKTRIVKSLLDYARDPNFILLERRIQFLTGNYSIRKNDEGSDLRAGIYYNYLQVNNFQIFHELNTFYRKALFSRAAKFGNKISLTALQKKRLAKYCFVAGFELKVYNEFTYIEIREIINCWGNG